MFCSATVLIPLFKKYLRFRSITLNNNLEEVTIPDCDDPDKVYWIGHGATSLSMDIEGEGVLAEESVETWLDDAENTESVPARIEWVFPSKTITWTGKVQVNSFGITAPNGSTVTSKVSMASDGEMVRVVTPAGS